MVFYKTQAATAATATVRLATWFLTARQLKWKIIKRLQRRFKIGRSGETI